MSLLLLLVLASCSRPVERPPSKAEAPNILLISLDTLRSDRLPCYGYDKNTAPWLCQIAAEGAQFDRSWAQTPATDGTHSSLFTSRHPYEHGKLGHTTRLGDEHLTLAEHLAAQGYRTAAFASSMKFIPNSGFDQGFETYEHHPKVHKSKRSARVNAAAASVMAEPGDAPWFIFAHYFDVHAPYHAPEPYGSRFLVGEALKPAQTVNVIRRDQNGKQKATPAVLASLRSQYDGQIAYLDHMLASLWPAIQADTDRPTLVLLTADHGEAMKEHDFLGHGIFLYEELLRVPLIVWYPGVVPAGRRIQTPVQSVDVYPTLVELAGLPVPPGLSGHSFASTLRGGPEPSLRRALVLQAPKRSALLVSEPAGLFKYTERHRSEPSPRLVRVDGPLASESDVSDQFPALRQQLEAHMGSLPVGRRAKAAQRRQDIGAEEEEELRALGYIDEE